MVKIINTNNETEFELVLRNNFIFSPSKKITAIAIYDGKADDSEEVKLFISEIYKQYYGAKIIVTFPYLMALLDKNNNILAAAGFRPAKDNNLFLEQYLDDKIENILSQKYQKNISRNEIVEIGSLASNGGGMAKFLFIALATYFKKYGYNYATMTGTKYLRNSFAKLRLKPFILANADKSRLTSHDEDWGSYYQTAPKVMTGDIESGYKTLKIILGAKIIPLFSKLYPFKK